MKRLAALLLTLLLLPTVFSCQKIETFGTLTVMVEAEKQRDFTLRVYPYFNQENRTLPIFEQSYNCQKVTEEIQLSPGNYFVEGPGDNFAVNIIAGKNLVLKYVL